MPEPRSCHPPRVALRHIIVAAACLLVSNLATSSSWAQGWPTLSGGLDHTRSAVGQLEGEGHDALAPLWSIPSAGPPQHTLIADIDGDDETELLFVVSGRARAYSMDGTLEWMSRPADLSAALPPIDLDGDGYMELVFRRRTHGVAILSGRDGALLWRSELEALSAVRTILARDLDGDGLPELVVAERDCGPQARAIGRTIVYRMADPRAPVELLRLEERTRDYECSSANVLMDTDGDGVVEIVAVGHEHVYVYSSEDGRLLEVSETLAPIPYGQAEPIVVQLPGRVEQSLLLLTDNNYAPNVNSRKALLVARDDSGALSTRWEASVADVGRDRHVWAAQPVLDLDNSGTPELLHAFFDADSGQWTTYARSLDDGSVIAAVSGRLGGVLPPGEDEVLPGVLIADEGFTQLEMYRLVGIDSGDFWISAERVFDGEELLETRAAFDLEGSGRPRALPEQGSTLLTLDSRDAAGAPSDTLVIKVLDEAGEILSEQTWGATTKITPGRAPGDALRVITSDPNGDVMLWDGALAEVFEAPLSLPLTATEGAMVVFDASGQRALAARHRSLFDASRANLATPASHTPIAQWVFGALSDDPVQWIAYDQDIKPENIDLVAVSASGDVLWSQSGLVALGDDSRVFWRGVSLTRDLDGDGQGEVLVQTDHRDAGLSRAQAYSGASGAPLWSPPFEDSSGVLSNVPPTTIVTDDLGTTQVALIRGGRVMTLDPASGASLATGPVGGLHRVTPGALADDGVETLFSAALVRPFWRATDADVSTRWEQNALIEDSPVAPPFRYYGTGVAFARSAQGAWLIEGRRTITPYDHNLVVLDAETGEFLHRLRLEVGEVLTPDVTTSAQATLNAGVVITPTDGGPPQYFVASEDGFLYWLDLTADASSPGYPQSMLLAVWSLGAPLGETSAADLDGDGALEIMVATLDGDVIILDQPELETEIVVLDTPCAGPVEDIDATPRTSEFCADWTATGPLSERFVASLHHSDGGRVAEPQVVEDGTHARFEGLRLEIGERYHVVVQGFDGEGVEAESTRIFRSDGALILPNVDPPQIQDLTAEPPAFFAVEEQTLISATLHDESGLTGYTLTIREGDGEPVLEVEEALNAVTHPIALIWRGDLDGAALPPGIYFVELTACDFDGRCSEDNISVELLDPDAPPEDISPPVLEPDVMDIADVADNPPDMDAGSIPDAVSDASPDVADDAIIEERVVACECRITTRHSGGGLGGAALAWVFGLMLMWRARRAPGSRRHES